MSGSDTNVLNPELKEQLSSLFSAKSVVTDKNFLKMKSNPIGSLVAAKKVLECLEESLKKYSTGIGLSAIQIGIPFRIALIKWKGQRVELINPKIVEQEEEFINTEEACLSVPGASYNVKRFKHFIIDNDVIDGDNFRTERQYYFYDEGSKEPDLVAIAVQHEIDHMEGILISDKGTKIEPIRRDPKVGRNEPCPCGSGKKYKKCCLK